MQEMLFMYQYSEHDGTKVTRRSPQIQTPEEDSQYEALSENRWEENA